MTKIMNASDVKVMTDGQIENAVGQFRDALRKHRSEISSDVAQQVLGVENFGMIVFAPFRERAEMISKQVVRCVPVNRTREPRKALEATGRNLYVNDDVVATMPKGTGKEAEVVFFNLGRYVSDTDLDKEYELRGLVPADPYSLAAVNEADPTFAEKKPHGTHWKDADGKWCFATFDLWDDERDVIVDRDGDAWLDGWWFAGVRKAVKA